MQHDKTQCHVAFLNFHFQIWYHSVAMPTALTARLVDCSQQSKPEFRQDESLADANLRPCRTSESPECTWRSKKGRKQPSTTRQMCLPDELHNPVRNIRILELTIFLCLLKQKTIDSRIISPIIVRCFNTIFWLGKLTGWLEDQWNLSSGGVPYLYHWNIATDAPIMAHLLRIIKNVRMGRHFVTDNSSVSFFSILTSNLVH